MPRKVKASEIVVAGELMRELRTAMAPIEAWRHIEAPEIYLESQSGKYIAGMEEVLVAAIRENDLRMAFDVLKELNRMTKVGKAKAEVALSGISKLRNEADLASIDTEQLMKIVGQIGGGE